MIIKNIMGVKYKQKTENGNIDAYTFRYYSAIKHLGVFRKWDFFPAVKIFESIIKILKIKNKDRNLKRDYIPKLWGNHFLSIYNQPVSVLEWCL